MDLATTASPISLMPNASRAKSNLYGTTEFLDAIAKVYFASKTCRVANYSIAGRTFRLLEVEGQGPLVKQTFLDIHEPLEGAEAAPSRRGPRRLEGASSSLMTIDEFKSSDHPPDFFGAPTVRWAGFKRWEDYLELLRKRRVLADDMRRRRRLEETLGSLEFLADDTAQDVLPTCFEWKSARDREANRPELFATEANRQFFTELRARNMLKASTLRAGGKLLAVWLGAVHDGRWTGWVFVFNNDASLSKFSVGRQLLYFMLEQSYREGHSEFDFSIGLEPYKLFFATHVRVVRTLGTPPLGERILATARPLLARAPWLYDRARGLKQWLVSQMLLQ